MAQKFLSPINVVQGAVFPATAHAGDLFFRSDIGSMYAYDGSGWVSMVASDITNVDGGDASASYQINWDGGGPSSF
jgi:hypothetical protein|tara:strand:+ start:4815 stop:5042 length:228 start_codon:yes stop_codon:yes gene_type:complete